MHIKRKALQLEMPISGFYKKQYKVVEQSEKTIKEQIEVFSPLETLTEPKHWYEALALLEYAIDTDYDAEQTQDFFEWLFKGFDCNASVDLDAEGYDWYWKKIHEVIDKQAVRSADALVEKALQYYSARRGYTDKQKTIDILREGWEKGSEDARTILGYYLFFGFCGPADKEQGLALMDAAETERGRGRVAIYKGFIAVYDNNIEEAEALLERLEAQSNDPFLIRMALEQRAFIYDLQGKYTEAMDAYRKVLEMVPSGFAMLRMAFILYNKLGDASDPQKALIYLEEAFRYGRPDAIRTLFYCYSESGEEWQDEEKGFYWLEQGYLYNDGYSTWQLAATYLFNDNRKDIKKGLALLDEAIEMEYTDAFITKAYLLYNGELVEENKIAGLQLLERGMELGSANAAYRLGLLFDSGETSEDNEPDYGRAIVYFEKAAELNEASACEYAGRYYLYGLGVEKDLEKAKFYYEKGRSLGSPYCIVELALMYEDGTGVEEDAVKSFELLTESVAYNYPYGQYLLGRCYRYGLGTDENPDKAVEYFQLAVDQEQTKAMAELAICYEYGDGVETNGPKALELMKRAAELEYTYAEYKTGCYYLYGMEGVPVDYPEAFKWLSKAAESEYPYANLELGDYFLYDYEGKEEYERSYPYYVKAAAHDVINEGLGVCLEYGYGTEVNEGEAFKYYLKGAEDGYIRAMYYVAACYYYGTGVKENYPEAFRWFNDAANQGHNLATYYKGKMLMDGEGCTINIEEGISLLQQAAENDIANAQFDLANCYLTGKGVDENEDLAMEWFEKASDNGHEKALKITGRRRRK